VLRDNGIFILISYGDPEHRVPVLYQLNLEWSIDADRFGT
jgi:hypothetical protein